MKLLIDTHTFLWFISDSNELSERAKNLIESENNLIFISIGRLNIKGDYSTVIDDIIVNHIVILSINFAHTVEQNKLSFYHRYPFDKIIISQAIVEEMDFISIDTIFDKYLIDKNI